MHLPPPHQDAVNSTTHLFPHHQDAVNRIRHLPPPCQDSVSCNCLHLIRISLTRITVCPPSFVWVGGENKSPWAAFPLMQSLQSVPPSTRFIASTHWHCLKPVLNWTNVCSPEHTSDTSTNYDSFLNWTFSSPNMVRTVQTLLHSQLACNEMQASAQTCGRRAADSMIENLG